METERREDTAFDRDTNLEITPEQVHDFLEAPYDVDLSAFTEITDEAAGLLSGYEGVLILNGLRKLSKTAATALASQQGILSLNGLQELPRETAEALSNHQGDLFLNGLRKVDPVAAQNLSSIDGSVVLEGIMKSREIDFQANTQISQHLDLSEKAFWRVYALVRKGHGYEAFEIPKRSGGTRKIHKPVPGLFRVQKLIKEHILCAAPNPLPCATAFREGYSIRDHARVHCNKKILVKFDLKDFFPSVSFTRVARIFRDLGFTYRDAGILGYFTTIEVDPGVSQAFTKDGIEPPQRRGLPQGSPTSPQLANLSAGRLDARLLGLAKSLGFDYTRYADDLTFSSGDTKARVNVLKWATEKIVRESGFTLNPGKTKVMRSPATMVTTGLIVNGTEPKVPRATIRRVRAMFHQARLGKLSENELEKLKGYLSFIRMVNPSQADKLERGSGPNLE